MRIAVVLLSVAGFCLGQQVRGRRVPQSRYEEQQQPQQPIVVTERPVEILRMASDLNYDGTFSYGFEAENGISAYQYGGMKELGPEKAAQNVQGGYAYTAPDGTPIQATYYADETGFHIEGAHLPTPPPVPAAIAKMLEILPPLQEPEEPEPLAQPQAQPHNYPRRNIKRRS